MKRFKKWAYWSRVDHCMYVIADDDTVVPCYCVESAPGPPIGVCMESEWAGPWPVNAWREK